MAELSDNTNWFETDASNNRAPPNGWPEGMMPGAVNDTARADKGALKRFWDRINPIQTISPSGGVWTFTTGNAAYPTAYVEGEFYVFSPIGNSAAGDQFQVNGLGPKPIYKRTLSGWVPIASEDMTTGHPAQLIYANALTAGAGGFILVNPFLSIVGDGAGGFGVPGNISAENLALLGSSIYFMAVTPGAGPFHIADNTNQSFRLGPSNGGFYFQNYGGATAMSVDAVGDLVASGNITAAGSLYSGGALYLDGVISSGPVISADAADIYFRLGPSNGEYNFQNSAGGPILHIASNGYLTTPSGITANDIFAANDIVATGVFRESVLGAGPRGARIECVGGGDWDSIAFLMSGGFLLCTPNGGTSGFRFQSVSSFSDARLKDNIRDSEVDALAAVLATPLRAFEWNDEGRKLMPHMDAPVPCGFVAQELEEAIPVAVKALFPDGFKHVFDERLTPYLFRAIQQLAARVTELEDRLARE